MNNIRQTVLHIHFETRSASKKLYNFLTSTTSSLHSHASGQKEVAHGRRKRRRKTVEKTLSSEEEEEEEEKEMEEKEMEGKRRGVGDPITA